MTVIKFKDYSVLDIEYRRNENFKEDSERLIVDPKISAKLKKYDDLSADILLIVEAGSLRKFSSPFRIKVKIKGSFSYVPDEDDIGVGFERFLTTNAVAILYPYARALVSTVTSASNEFPAFNLPVMNIAKALDMSESKTESNTN